MVQIGWTGLEYDLVPLNDNGDVVVDVPEELFPDFILEQGSGTIVTYLGNTPKENTVVPGQTVCGCSSICISVSSVLATEVSR